MKLNYWINAARLKTLPLALSCIIMGSAIAFKAGKFDLIIFLLALLTTLLLQILSNYANDYGDAVSGKDSNRLGDKRMVASGLIAQDDMKKGVILLSILSLISGIVLISYSFQKVETILLFFGLGLAAIWAAVKYTAGKNPYGYKGLGDLFVFLFFGLVGVMGSAFLFTKQFEIRSILPAIAIGVLSAAVLTLNNLRDIENDEKTGKNTLIVKMGFAKGKAYFAILLFIAFFAMVSYALLSHFENRQYLFLIAFLPLSNVMKKVLNITQPIEMNPYLKTTALATFILSVLTFVGISWFQA
jgi:1,4-dihydroxy-2-naphthoate octaprenyltransferase